MKFGDWILEDLKLDPKHDMTTNSHVSKYLDQMILLTPVKK